MPSKLDLGIACTTSALFLDVVFGQAFTGRPLHELLGIEFPDYLQKTEDIATASGWGYLVMKDIVTKGYFISALNGKRTRLRE